MSAAIDIRKLPDALFVDLAIGAHTFEDVCRAYNLDHAAVEEASEDDYFRHKLEQARQSVEDTGKAFRARCRAVASDAIAQVRRIIYDPDAAANVQLEAFKTVAKFGELEPAKVADAAQTGPSLTLTIVAPGGEQRIEHRVGPSPAALPAIEHDCGSTTIDLSEYAWVEV